MRELLAPVTLTFTRWPWYTFLFTVCFEIYSLTQSLFIFSTDTDFFYQNLIFVAENHVYKHCGDVCNDVILMQQFLEVVRQHILGVVRTCSVTYYCSKFNRLSSSERILKIGEGLTK